jgi:hypothetical protein
MIRKKALSASEKSAKHFGVSREDLVGCSIRRLAPLSDKKQKKEKRESGPEDYVITP